MGDVRGDAGRVFDYASYLVTVGLSNTVQLRLLGNYSVMFELLESISCCLARHFFLLLFPPFSLLFLGLYFLSGCNKGGLFNLRVSSLTEPGLYNERKTHDSLARSHGRTLTRTNSEYHDHAFDKST